MKPHLLFVVPVLYLAQAAPAQEPMAPASQLSKFEPFIGEWEVSGTMREAPDGAEVPWTARESLRWALGGHFVQEDLIIDFGEAMPGLVFTSYMGWDNDTQRYVSFGASNLGEVGRVEPRFIDDNTMITARTGFMEGQFVVERSVMKLGDGAYTFDVDLANGAGPFFTHVKGKAERTAPRGQGLPVEASMSFVPPAPEMAPFEKMVGEYGVTGTMIPAPGMPESPISGTETFSLVMGGTVLMNRVSGDAGPDEPPYESVGFTAWNPEDQCYDMISVDNMGMSAKAQFRNLGDGVFVSTASAMMYGQPTVMRSIMTCNDQGIPVSVVSDAMMGAEEPQRVFSGNYTKK